MLASAWESPATRLICSKGGRVIGVEVLRDGQVASFRARNGVVLASGGFGFNPSLKENYLPASPSYFYGNPASTGDGIAMAQAVGASLCGSHESDDGQRGTGSTSIPTTKRASMCPSWRISESLPPRAAKHPAISSSINWASAAMPMNKNKTDSGHSFSFRMLQFESA